MHRKDVQRKVAIHFMSLPLFLCNLHTFGKSKTDIMWHMTDSGKSTSERRH